MSIQQGNYRLFGDLWLPAPENCLDSERLTELKRLEPLIREKKLEGRKRTSGYDLDKIFLDFTIRETEEWRRLGVDRPSKFLLHPSGDINAPIACHLHNPTFYVKDPNCQETDNSSNPTIWQINQAGFSSAECFFFDHICRRERTEDVLSMYQGAIYEIHEAFALSLRVAMGAKVEICWGKHVRERMKKLVDLKPFRLWGEYEEVELFLEIVGSKLLRFVIFVAHPQYFFYHGTFTQSGVRFRAEQARTQDLCLAVASKLGSIGITEGFYEHLHRPARYGQFQKKYREVVKQLEADAEAQLKQAFPEKFGGSESLANIAACMGPSQLLYSEAVRGSTGTEVLRRAHQISEMSLSILSIAGQVITGDDTVRSISQLDILSNVPSEWDDVREWDALPSALVAWIQAQDGLKIDQKPICSREELMAALLLLLPTNAQLSDESLMSAVLKVAGRYIARARKQRHESVRALIVPGAAPYNVMPRKCARCGKRVLDDAFACFAKDDPRRYVIWYRSQSCGHLACRSITDGTSHARLIPADPNQAYTIAETASLERARTTSRDEYLLRLSNDERAGLPTEVATHCRKCGKETFLDQAPRWTAENQPRYVVRVRGCNPCGERFCSFDPIDPTVPTISQASVSKKWKDLQVGGVDPTQYPRRPDILWSGKSHLTKRKELEREKARASGEDTSREVKKRNFNPKSRKVKESGGGKEDGKCERG